MRRIIAIILSVMAIVLFSACDSDSSTEAQSNGTDSASVSDTEAITSGAASVSAKNTVSDIVSKYKLSGGYIFTSESDIDGENLDSDMISTYYGDGSGEPDFTKVTEYCVYIDESDAKTMTEVGMFKVTENTDTGVFRAYIQGRIDQKLAQAKNYPDIDKKTLESAIVEYKNGWIYYVVMKDVAESVGKTIGDVVK